MTTPPPFDVTPISTPLPDSAHEAMRQTVLSVISEMWTQHLTLVDTVTTAQADITSLKTDVSGLQTSVAALQATVKSILPPPPVPLV